MVCSKCGSQNVTAQVISTTHLKEKKRSFLWWAVIGWWWVPIKWVCFFLPALIIKIFSPKKYKTKTKTKQIWICNNCGKQF